jgi:hypothetical protein
MTLEAPNKFYSYNDIGTTFFLAGTIDNGLSVNWQKEIADYADEINVTVFNPRRREWNPLADSKDIELQINWELEHMEKADYIIMNILENSKSPISLLELGLHARDGKLIVFCPKNFYRYDNIKVTCETYGIKLFSMDSYRNTIDEIKLLILERKNANRGKS